MYPVRVIAGLGNPGPAYDGTRHNIGFAAVDQIAAAHSAPWKAESRLSAHTASIETAGRPVLLLKPQTFMNASGLAISKLCRFYKWPPGSVLVVVDEFQLELGRAKLTLQGSGGGHNGVEDIIRHLGPDFPRFRIGIAPREPSRLTMTDYVLGKFSGEEIKTLANCWERILSEIELCVQKDPDLAMNTINQRFQKNEPSNQTEVQDNTDPGFTGL